MLLERAPVAAGFEKVTVKTDSIADGPIGLTGLVGRLAEAQKRTDQSAPGE